MALPKEYKRRIDDPQLLLIGELEGYAPIQGTGTVAGNPFYFRSRWDTWSFAISDDPEVDVLDICVPESAKYGFFAEATVSGGPYAASYLPLDTAEQIIKDCCRQYHELRSR
ncbi:hypothetical protein LGH70_14065 [Hymenobacter sp. BT635]|uniref:Uncharacterized protein n=1 Tax=Hymenobacter nitidus TaxID=2880929 RepID=A0ABS8AE63_9BACT|nr:hypothetical protein [Hymenobacter nitidus]MCB2378723.1 hypothetical protein [Hymenobacter nitidus]